MADRPILFSAPMVRALLAGTKTQTRRILNPQPTAPYLENGDWWDKTAPGCATPMAFKAYPGDRLYVREEFSGPFDFKPKVNPPTTWPVGCDIWYWADGNPEYGDWNKPKRAMHMPRWMSRLTLPINDVRVERLQDISETDARAEGVEPAPDHPGWWKSQTDGKLCPTARDAYGDLWNAINGEGAWQANPWVVAYTFSVQHGNIDQIAKVA